MNILFIAPIPPPLTGNSLAASVFLNRLKRDNNVEVVNLNKNSFQNGVSSLKRIGQILGILKKVWNLRRSVDLIYFSISESSSGNIKDILIYLICFKKLKMTIIHMLGGAGMKRMIDKRGVQYKLNKFFISRLAGVIVEGEQQALTFSKVIKRDRIFVVNNFAEDFLFINKEEVKKKFENKNPLKILFLSNLLYGKGHNELAEAYIGLSVENKKKIKITYIGGFESEKNKDFFLQKIKGESGLEYRGKFVSGIEKKECYCNSHIFSLPTYYPYEGQPISILEAYATGCVVITTPHSGIPEVFSNGLNGFEVEKQSPESIRKVLESIIINGEQLVHIALQNRNIAYENYRTEIYEKNLMKVVSSLIA